MSELGSPGKPLEVKCLSIAGCLPENPYLSLVSKDGRQFYFELGLTQLILIRAEAQSIEDRWRSKEPRDAA